MRICFLAHNPGKGTGYGIDRYSFELIKRVQKEFDTLVLSQGNLNNSLAWITKELGFPIKVIRAKADLFHALSQQIAKAAVLTSKRPLVTTIHDLIPFKSSLTSFYQRKVPLRGLLRFEYMRVSALLAKKSDLIIAPFEVVKRDIISTLGVEADKIRVVPYGVDTEFFTPTKGYEKSHTDRRTILSIGGMSIAKGADSLMKAFSSVVKEYSDCELWIVGAWKFFDGIRLAKDLNILDKVKFLGYLTEGELLARYNLADVIVLPSRIGFSLPILEGMACKKPIIASNTPDIQEVVGNSGLLVPPTDTDKIAHAIISVLFDERLRSKLANEGYKKSKLFSWEKTVEKTISVYAEVASFQR